MIELDRVGGRLCLDFVNTVEPRYGPVERDHLRSYQDLVGWAEQPGLLDGVRAARLLAEADRHPSVATAAFTDAVTLREAIYYTFTAIAHGQAPSADDLDTIHQRYVTALQHAELVTHDGRYDWAWHGDALELPGWPVALSAVELMRHGPLDRLKTCPDDGEGCGWLFLDGTKNRSRRWCSMQTCGAEVKTRHQTARRRAARASA